MELKVKILCNSQSTIINGNLKVTEKIRYVNSFFLKIPFHLTYLLKFTESF